MSDRATAAEDRRSNGREASDQPAGLRGELDALRAENHRLRRESLRARQTQYRNAAIGMFAVGTVALIGALLFPAFRTVLLVLAGTGAFGGVLIYFLTPDRLVPVSVGRAAYDAHAAVGRRLQSELGLQDVLVYAPLHDDETTGESVRLFVPQTSQWVLPEEGSLRSMFVSPDSVGERGVSFTPAAATLYDEFERGLGGALSVEADELVVQLGEAAVEQFELARRVDGTADESANRVTFRVTSPAYGSMTGFDHPLVSFIGVGLADALSSPVAVESVAEDGSDTFVVTYRYDATRR